jgi:hypothetical protein
LIARAGVQGSAKGHGYAMGAQWVIGAGCITNGKPIVSGNQKRVF